MKILFLGDFLYDYNEVNDDILAISEYIKENDLITILNFEGVFKSEHPYKKSVNLHCSPKVIEILNLLNVKAVNLANNHIMDYSKEGLEILIKKLDRAGIGHFGAGMNLEESLKPYIFEYTKNRTIAFYGFGWKTEECVIAKEDKAGVAPLDFDLVDRTLRKYRVNHIIPTFHFGYEYERLPQPYHYKRCSILARNKKVKAIIGHHPHVVQGYDKRKNIFYSLGNFYFGTRRKNYTKDFKHYPHVNQGIGVIINTLNWKCEIIKFVSDGECTKIDNNVVIDNLIDISKFAITDYPKYFKENNNTINKGFVYGIGSFNEKIINKTNYGRRELHKKYLRKIKWPLIRTIKKIFRIKKGKKNDK